MVICKMQRSNASEISTRFSCPWFAAPFPGGDLMCAFYYYRKACLRKWKNRKGFMATYGKLLDACLRTDNLKCAEKIIMLLGATSMFVYYS